VYCIDSVDVEDAAAMGSSELAEVVQRQFAAVQQLVALPAWAPHHDRALCFTLPRPCTDRT
jgi:hypothetical protein